jgi:hypothetical protein
MLSCVCSSAFSIYSGVASRPQGFMYRKCCKWASGVVSCYHLCALQNPCRFSAVK